MPTPAGECIHEDADEIGEGTTTFKCTNSPPVGESRFVTYEGLPSDHYLWLTGMGARLLRDEIKPTDAMPLRHTPTGVRRTREGIRWDFSTG